RRQDHARYQTAADRSGCRRARERSPGAISDRVFADRQRSGKVSKDRIETRGSRPLRPCSRRLPRNRTTGRSRGTRKTQTRKERKSMNLNRKVSLVLTITLSGVLGACATGGDVDKKIAQAQAETNKKFESVSGQIEDLQTK